MNVKSLPGSTKYLPFLCLLWLALSCAPKAPPATAEKSAPCTLTDTSGCPEYKPSAKPMQTPAPAQAQPVAPFYEGSSTEDLAEDEGLSLEDPPASSEIVIGEEVEDEISKLEKGAIPQFDIPIVVNKQVEKWIHYFQGRGRKFFASWLARSEKYIPMMKPILRENGLPEDLIYLAMIESGFKPYAYSSAKASGPWQFIKGTGRRYGLRVTWWIDERRDPEKSTIAAAQHLKDLYDQFNSWYLAAAGYNAGAGKIEKAIRRYSTEDFWEMSKYSYLKSETKNYVPKMIAAALIAKEPERYGFHDIEYEEPLIYDKVRVLEPTGLTEIANALGVPEAVLVELNPELRRNMTPPDFATYELKVPKGYQEKFIAAYPEIRRRSPSTIVRHVVSKGESLQEIAKNYKTSSDAIVAFNRLKSRRVKRGQQLAIPFHLGKGRAVAQPAVFKPAQKGATYQVRSGDTLWSIARQFDVSVVEIREWNKLSKTENIHPGQKLSLQARADPVMMRATNAPAPPPPPLNKEEKWETYRVQPGDNLWSISKRHGVKISDLLQWNDLEEDATLRPGSQLKVKGLGL